METPPVVAMERNTEAYHLQSLRSAFIREEYGGIKAADSGLFIDAVSGLLALGLTEQQVIKAAQDEQRKIRCE